MFNDTTVKTWYHFALPAPVQKWDMHTCSPVAQIQKSPFHVLECKSCIWKDSTDISEMKIWLFLDRQWAKDCSNFLKIFPCFIFNSIEISDWALIHSPVVRGLKGIKTAPAQPLTILAVVGLGSAALPNGLFLTVPDNCSTFLDC